MPPASTRLGRGKVLPIQICFRKLFDYISATFSALTSHHRSGLLQRTKNHQQRSSKLNFFNIEGDTTTESEYLLYRIYSLHRPIFKDLHLRTKNLSSSTWSAFWDLTQYLTLHLSWFRSGLKLHLMISDHLRAEKHLHWCTSKHYCKVIHGFSPAFSIILFHQLHTTVLLQHSTPAMQHRGTMKVLNYTTIRDTFLWRTKA